jgi:hypothetical protein
MKNQTHHSVSLLIAVVCLFVAPLAVFAQISDDFSHWEFDPATWVFIDPAGDCSTDTYDGLLTIGMPAGTEHDLRGSSNRAASLMQDVTDGDFEIEAKFQSTPVMPEARRASTSTALKP